MSIVTHDNRLSENAVIELGAKSDMIECECPARLLAILKEVRDFAQYTEGCIAQYPNDAKTHQWLHGCAVNLDTLLSSTIAQLARFEGYIDQNNDIQTRKK